MTTPKSPFRKRKTLDVPIVSWAKWKAAAKASNLRLLTFIVTVCDLAAEQILEEAYDVVKGVENEDEVCNSDE